ncbi:MAG: DUF4402 domain-containing protein [Alphaproteobacteria bacterium]|nr:DUF4402 domain-containing protein [Alphaproteobacteria bacterium]
MMSAIGLAAPPSAAQVVELKFEKNLAFGTVFVGRAGGAITMSPGGVATTNSTGLFHQGGGQPAEFTLSTMPNTAFTVAISGSAPLTTSRQPGRNGMTIREFRVQTTPLPPLNNLDRTKIAVGATIDIAGNQASGEYRGTYSITINHNKVRFQEHGVS